MPDVKLGELSGARPFATVIVPVKDGLELLQRCVAALLAQDYPRDRYEIVVVDNGSTDSPVGRLPDDPRLLLLDEPRPGSYRARNLGVSRARGEIIAFTDADCRPAADWLRVAVQALVDDPSLDMIGGRVALAYRSGEPRNGPEWYEFAEGFPQERYLRTGFAVTANMVTRRSVFDRVGTFDADLLSGGDAEWGRRVRDAGGIQKYVPDASVEHPARDSWPELRTKAARTTGGIVRRTWKGSRPRQRLVRLLAGQAFRSVMLPLSVVRRSDLPSVGARLKFLVTRWRVDGIIVLTLLRGLIAARPR